MGNQRLNTIYKTVALILVLLLILSLVAGVFTGF